MKSISLLATYTNIRSRLRMPDLPIQVSLAGLFRQLSNTVYRPSSVALALTLLLSASFPGHATDYYVDSDSGDDSNPGTIVYPWKTIAKVMASTGSYDRVYFQRGDTWKERLNVPASNMIFDAYGEGSKPTIDGENIREHAFHINGWHDIVIRNFNIVNVTKCGIQFSSWRDSVAYNLTVTNNDFTNMGEMGVRTYAMEQEQLDGIVPYGVSIQGNTFTNLGNYAIGLIATDTAPNFISENIIIRAGNGNFQTNAMQLSAKGLIVEKNIVMDTVGGPSGDGHSIIVDWGVPGHPETESENVTVRYNFVSGSTSKSESSGIHVWHGKNNRVYGNISVNNSIGYKISNSTSTGNEFYNNVAYGNTMSAAQITNTAPASIWKNNIFYGINDNDTGMAIYGVAPVESNNIIYNFAAPVNPGATMDSSDIIADPLFHNPLAYDFSLQFGSPAIDNGTDLSDIVNGLIMPGSISPENIALVDQNNNSVLEIGAYAYVETALGNSAPSLPILVSPENNESRLGETVKFQWMKSTDPDNDVLTYRLTYCTDQSFSNCNPVDVAMGTTGILYSGTMGMLFFGITFFGGMSRRRIFAPVIVMIVVLECVSLMSCEITNDLTSTADVDSYSASGLEPGTTYYWKVEANDLHGGVTQSTVWSFYTK
jgi:hypothetical protein